MALLTAATVAVLIVSQAFAMGAKDCSTVLTYDFHWRGQFAGFIVNGRFSFDSESVPDNGIVREDALLRLDVSFYDPKGLHLRTYENNQKMPVDEEGAPYLNFAFDTLSQELLQDGTWNVDDNENRYRNGFMMGEGKPSRRKENGSQTGIAFWSRPSDDKTPHLHVDDWNDANGDGEFGYPIGYSSHEDASFQYYTTQERIETNKVGAAYYQATENGTVVLNSLASDVRAYGQLIRVTPVFGDNHFGCTSESDGNGAGRSSDPAPDDSIASVVCGHGKLSTLCAAVAAAGLEETLAESGPFTLFAPNNDAFEALPDGTLESLLEDIPALTDILLYHVLDGEVYSTDLVCGGVVKMVSGKDSRTICTDNGKVFQKGTANHFNAKPRLVDVDVKTSNGVVHVVTNVMLPAS